jgi:hypothetical protein
MSILKLVASVALAAATLTAIHAERRCPGNVVSVPLRQIQGALIVVPVSVNGSGPFDFLVDSGAQITSVDTQLASQLGPQSIGSTGVSGVATSGRKSATQLARMEIGAHRVENVLAVVEDMAQLHQADPKLRGIVGENFLAHFDFLIDNEHRFLCLDESGALASSIKGPRLPLAQPYGPDRDLPFTRPLVIATQLAGTRTPMLLRLDSGSNAAVLYATPAEKSLALNNAQILKRAIAGTEQDFAVLQPQPIAAAGHTLCQITFVQPMNSVGAATQPREDGTLPTAIFRRVFVSYSSQFAILEPGD